MFPIDCSYRPHATQVVSPADRDIIEEHGVAVVECSWARLDEIPFGKLKSPHERLCMCLLIGYSLFTDSIVVPYLIASNPVNYGPKLSSLSILAHNLSGRPWKLNCAEAIAAAFYITGFKPYGDVITSKFSWGTSFVPLNRSVPFDCPNGSNG